jgi:hypothetical protein
MIDVLSLGWGTQSTALAFLAAYDIIPRPDYIMFSDTQREPKRVRDYIKYATPLLKERGLEVIEVTKGDLGADFLKYEEQRVSGLPIWGINPDTNRESPLIRQCTEDYKITPINRKVRELLGVKRLKRHSIRMWMGITVDEKKRYKQLFQTKQNRFRVNHYPFFPTYGNITNKDFDYSKVFGNGWSRNDCIEFFTTKGLLTPPKSSCIFCPFHTDTYWLDMKINHPEEFEYCCEFDEGIRNFKGKGKMKIKKWFLHRSCKPLKDIDFAKRVKDKTQNSLFDFEGCNSGFCFT